MGIYLFWILATKIANKLFRFRTNNEEILTARGQAHVQLLLKLGMAVFQLQFLLSNCQFLIAFPAIKSHN